LNFFNLIGFLFIFTFINDSDLVDKEVWNITGGLFSMIPTKVATI
jgi:hypothetical protein